MRRSDWGELPAIVRAAVEQHTGAVTACEASEAGEHSDITATLHTATGRVFVKGMRTEPVVSDLWALRREARINRYVSQYAPRLLWTAEAGGWLVLGFEHIEARHADFSPGSPDLELLAKTVEAFQTLTFPGDLKGQIERRWEDYADDVSPFQGAALIHADINPKNMLITRDDQVYVVDWGFASRGAAWVELAILVQWLIGSGHTPAEADTWARQFPSWRAADPAAVDLLARVNAARWRDLSAAYGSPSWAVELTGWVEQWARYRRA